MRAVGADPDDPIAPRAECWAEAERLISAAIASGDLYVYRSPEPHNRYLHNPWIEPVDYDLESFDRDEALRWATTYRALFPKFPFTAPVVAPSAALPLPEPDCTIAPLLTEASPATAPPTARVSKTVSVQRAAEILGVSVDTIQRRAKSGELRTVKLGGRRLVPLPEIHRLQAGPPRK